VGSALADRALELAVRDENPSSLGRVQLLQTVAHFYRGDLAGSEEHFTDGLEFFEHPSVKRIPGFAVAAFYCGASTAWMSGRTGTPRERVSRMLVAGDQGNPYELAFSGQNAADLLGEMREFKHSESMAERALEIAEKHNFSALISDCQLYLGPARAQLGRPTEGIALIRQGLASQLEIGQGVGISRFMSALAYAQRRAGLLIGALETIEGALRATEVPFYRLECLRISGELRLNNGEVELAETQLREGLVLVRTRGAKAWELRATMSLARC
jgi:tetratricopeptide (TPR) repeat protein